jgi:hypothetical protein
MGQQKWRMEKVLRENCGLPIGSALERRTRLEKRAGPPSGSIGETRLDEFHLPKRLRLRRSSSVEAIDGGGTWSGCSAGPGGCTSDGG